MKKIAALLLLFVILFFSAQKFVWGVWEETTFPEANTAYDHEGNISNSPFNVESFMNLTGTVAAGIGVMPLFSDQQTQTNYQKHSVLARINQGIALAYAQPPASTGEYLAYLGNKAGIVQPAYAQGIGFSGLSPIINIWRGFRNVAYGFLILVMVIIGFMILFRWKIDPRTVITIQSALPRIVLTLILITFSYAIVGLLIDAMYLVIYIAIFALGKTDQVILANFTGGALSNLYGTVFNSGISSAGDIANFLGIGTNTQTIGAIVGGLGALILGAPLALLTVPAGIAAGAALPQVLVTLIVGLILVFTLIRIFFLLLTAWVNVFISLIFGPLQLMLGAIPGVNTFGNWFKNLIGNLAVFPITILMIMIGALLSSGAQPGNLWTPPGLGGASPSAVASLIGLGVMLTIPSVVNGFKQALKAQSPIPAGPSALVAPLGASYGTLMQGLQAQYYLKGPVGGLVSRIRGR